MASPRLFRTTLLLAPLLLIAHDEPGPWAVLGRWHGHSTCVRAEWNASCNDEEVFYEFDAMPPDSNHLLLRAKKLVGAHAESMGDLAITYSAERSSWEADFANARVHIRWSYRLRGDTLEGEVARLPTLVVARHVVAWRDSLVP